MADYEAKLLEVLGNLSIVVLQIIFKKVSLSQLRSCRPMRRINFPQLMKHVLSSESVVIFPLNFFVDACETLKSIQLKYVIPVDKLENTLTGPARIKINGKFYRLFSKCPGSYKLNIFGFSRNSLNDESKAVMPVKFLAPTFNISSLHHL